MNEERKRQAILGVVKFLGEVFAGPIYIIGLFVWYWVVIGLSVLWVTYVFGWEELGRLVTWAVMSYPAIYFATVQMEKK